MTDQTFWPSSPEAIAKFNEKKRKRGAEEKYPWHATPVGSSFQVPKKNMQFKSLIQMCYKKSAALNKKFIAVEHDGDYYEVACFVKEAVTNNPDNQPRWQGMTPEEANKKLKQMDQMEKNDVKNSS